MLCVETERALTLDLDYVIIGFTSFRAEKENIDLKIFNVFLSIRYRISVSSNNNSF